ncbi:MULTISPECIES: FixH family protein [Bradyrhizobium]|jgi:nitrogen fixation protein FixH|uniref:FixH family protein n=2 Tax=Pseudomonadota TaxID=1224 RepID=A0ABS5G6F2_9BRAD|nr:MULTISPECIES: FixH family protein [Bradyrhizobium]RTM03326.1 MAG: nitrogen fixation protein FixH [Bradyrhizobiaceae bacterium]MBR1136905.1 FixH family protein [Bradyrhizobium denitrificans]MDU0956802.1 FixH family protein [Bradyrhizobium sp.]MDU1492510.1 FixH family protein [Bradyrhizobium sp.]MDU1542955.1 FixH family protein [Bradyrhizobium sp.]
MASRSDRSKPLTGRMVLAMLLGFFGTVIGVNVYMMKMAISTLPGTDVDSAYTASLGYEKEIAAARDQEARRWQVEAHIERGASGAAVVQVNARDASGNPLSGVKFQGRLERPADKRADQEVELAEIGIGIYRGTAEAIAPGQWDLVLEGDSSGRRLFLSKNRVLLN